ncbi:MAG: cation transport protein ChaC [Gammaproteobacteria bacterium]|jgi:cation transport protein ChaC
MKRCAAGGDCPVLSEQICVNCGPAGIGLRGPLLHNNQIHMNDLTTNWIFGYGSLIWRPSFDFVHAQPVLLRGWQRRFWQGSPDHRGTPIAPGRVVTIVEQAGAECWGMGFNITGFETEKILSELDIRESGGYVRLPVQIEFSDGSHTEALTYFAPPENPNYLGPAPLAQMSEQIHSSVGKSGRNAEYVMRLAKALREYDLPDDEVRALDSSVRQVSDKSGHG